MAKTRNELNQDRSRLESSHDLSARLLSTDEVARLLVIPGRHSLHLAVQGHWPQGGSRSASTSATGSQTLVPSKAARA
jgi:hypothetical protein